jgi:phosphoglucosamine mutase
LAVIVEKNRPASEVCRVFDPLPQCLKNVRFTGESPLRDDRTREMIRTAERRLASGRVLIRESGTEPLIRIMAEGPDEDLVAAVVEELAEFIALQVQPRADAA